MAFQEIMVVGQWRWPIYEESFCSQLSESGIKIHRFETTKYLDGFLERLQLKIPFLPIGMGNLNSWIIKQATSIKPSVILFWRPTLVLPKTLRILSEYGVKTVSYNNDDPFGPQVGGNVPWHHHWLWHWYLKCLPWFDMNFFYRQINCSEAKIFGAKHAEILLPYFLPWKDRPVELTASEFEQFGTDVVFVGHYEPDGREHSIRALVSAGVKVKIWGSHYWTREILGDLYDVLAPIVPAEGDKYPKALCGAKVCLCFLSKLNRDTYTRRCFEIPACGRVMLAERTDDLMGMFKEDEEACFFSSNEELVQKAQWLIANPDICEGIARAGMRRVWADGHDVESRARSFIMALDKHWSVNG
jgi:spore maturation protein CgeB